MDPSKAIPNPGLKAVAKLMLNSFCVKFRMRDTLPQAEFIYTPMRYYELMRSKGKKIHDKRETEKQRDWQRDKARLMRDKG